MSERVYREHLASNRYHDRHFDRDAVKILPGEYYVTRGDTLIVTVLGSCIAVCLRDSRGTAGGMNHFMLPGQDTEHGLSGRSARYGSYAMEVLINHLQKLGCDRRYFEAKVFGGGQVMKDLKNCLVGESNTEFVLDFLAAEKIPVVAQDVLGVYPRKVYFFPDSGRVLVKRIHDMHNSTILNRELHYSARLHAAPIEGDMELFE